VIPSPNQRDFYQVLGIARTATTSEIRAAFVRLARRHHPDAEGDLPRRLPDIQAAYRCLRDPGARAEHDRMIERGEQVHAARQQMVQRRLHGYDRRHPRPLPRGYRRWPWRSFLLTAGVAAVARLSLTLLG
jgi:DnaJ-class molecular chaperone